MAEPKQEMICDFKANQRLSRGIFMGDDPFKEPLAVFIMQLIVMAMASLFIQYLLRPLKQPKFVCNALAGILISPYITGSKNFFGGKDYPKFEILVPKVWAYFGLTYMLYLVAVKVDLASIRKNLMKASIIGLSGIVGSVIVILGIMAAFPIPGIHLGFFQCFLAVFLSLTRFPNVAYTFDELDILSSDLGQLAVSSSMVSEVVSWICIIVRLYNQSTQKQVNSWLAILSTIVFVVFVLFLLRPAVQKMAKNVPERTPVPESYVLLLLLGGAVGGLVSDSIAALQIGVLFIGLVIPNGPPLGSALTEKAEFIVMELIVPMFYVIVGMDVDLSLIDMKSVEKVFLISVAGALAKFAAGMGAAFFCKIKFHHAILMGLMLNIKGPFDYFNFIKWKSSKELKKKEFTVLVVTEILITAIVAPLIDSLYGKYVRVNASDAKRNMRGLHAKSRNEVLKVLCCIHREEQVPGMVMLLEATNPTQTSPLSACIVHLQNLVGQATPMLIPYGDQIQAVKSKESLRIMQAFSNYLNNSNGMISVHAYTVIAPYKNMHEYIYRLSQDDLIPLIIVPFHETLTVIDPAEAISIRNLNTYVQAHSSCTVGILVDKTVSTSMIHKEFRYSVGVIFMCGADDREALALAIRMLGHPTVSVTLLHLVINNLEVDGIDEMDSKLDIKLIEEFRAKSSNNELATYIQVEVEDTEQGFTEIRTLKGKHNLLIVGRQRQVSRSVFDEQMLNWSENPELGVIGDYISSTDFCNGQTSVLVMQQYSDLIGSGRHNSSDLEGEYLLQRSAC